MASSKQQTLELFRLIQYLEVQNEILEDRDNLRYQGLTEEELDGYEEFFFENYFPHMEDEV